MGCGQSNELIDYESKNMNKQHTINPHDVESVRSKKKVDLDPFINSKKNYIQIKKTYKVLHKIGGGAFGRVFKVFHVPSGQHRAMKVVKKEQTQQQDDDKIFLKEIEILAKLDHPNILKILEYFFDENHYYVVTDIINSGELFDHIQKDKLFSEEKACIIMEQLFSAVSYLHKEGICHRDLKLENILVDSSDDDNFQIKIIDFGASNFFKKNMSFKLKIGTPYYIAPEVLNKNYSYKCDIWSCGVIMYILLCGSPPFDGNSDHEIMEKVKLGEFDFKRKIWESISPEAKSLINELLKLDPSKRLTAEAAMNHPWMVKFSNKKKKDNQNVIKIERLNTFQPKHKFQQTTIAFLVHQMSSTRTNDNLKKIFNEMDTKKNGRLKYEDLKEGLRKYSELQFSDEEFEKLLKNLDNDENGYIEYEEFLRATMDMDSLLTENNLKMAFSFFDTDNSGKLSADELNKILGVMNQDNDEGSKIINKILSDIGNEDGLISYEDFKRIMKEALSEIILGNKEKDKGNNN